MSKVMMAKSDDQMAADMRSKSTRQCLAEFIYALTQLVIHLELPDVTELALNFHGKTLRVDIAQLTEDGQHLEQWLVGLNANVADPNFGARVALPSEQESCPQWGDTRAH